MGGFLGWGWRGEPRRMGLYYKKTHEGGECSIGCAFIAHYSGGRTVRIECAPYRKAKPRTGRGLTAQVRACNRQLACGPGWGLNGDARAVPRT